LGYREVTAAEKSGPTHVGMNRSRSRKLAPFGAIYVTAHSGLAVLLAALWRHRLFAFLGARVVALGQSLRMLVALFPRPLERHVLHGPEADLDPSSLISWTHRGPGGLLDRLGKLRRDEDGQRRVLPVGLDPIGRR
jgi:hypothetical protein